MGQDRSKIGEREIDENDEKTEGWDKKNRRKDEGRGNGKKNVSKRKKERKKGREVEGKKKKKKGSTLVCTPLALTLRYQRCYTSQHGLVFFPVYRPKRDQGTGWEYNLRKLKMV